MQSPEKCNTPYSRNKTYSSLVNKISNVAIKFRNSQKNLGDKLGTKSGESVFHAFIACF